METSRLNWRRSGLVGQLCGGVVVVSLVVLATPLAASADTNSAVPASTLVSPAPTPSVDAAPSVLDVNCTAGVCTVDFASNSPDATGYVVTWTDASGTVIATDHLDASASSDTISSVADATGDLVTVTAQTPGGALASDPFSFDISAGSTPSPGGPVVISGFTVTANGDGTYTVTWTSIAPSATPGFYLVTDDQGQSCSVPAVDSAGQSLSCVLGASADASAPTGVTVVFETLEFRVDNFGSVVPTFLSSGASGSVVAPTVPVASAPTPPASAKVAPVPSGLAVALESSNARASGGLPTAGVLAIGACGALMACALAMMLSRRARAKLR